MYPRWLYPAALVLFAVHALNYIYFFVDDEAITLVYAQNLLSGHGLSYSATQGRLEGYSNFLHVLLTAGWLTAVKWLEAPKVWIFAIGAAWSLMAAALTMYVAKRMMAATGASLTGAIAGLGFLALAGPFAAWATSTLETMTAAFLFLLLCELLTMPAATRRDILVSVTALLLLLSRIDGFVYAGAAYAGAFVFGDRDARRSLLRAIVPITLVLAGAYWAWRVWYFGDLLPMPFHAKIAFKLLPAGAAVTKLPDAPYLAMFAALYWYVPLVALIAGWTAFTRRRELWMLIAALTVAAVYVHLVGDWMFGYRFLVPLLPVAAVLVAATVGQLAARRRMAGVAACIAAVVLSGTAAFRLARSSAPDYKRSGYAGWPSRSASTYLGRYFPIVEALSTRVQAGDRIAYNQAGLVAYLLELDNLDTLGLCSRFYAMLPARDVVFTEVGRYSPLTNKPVLRATDMYLLRHRPRYILEPAHLLRGANGGVVPDAILGGRYRLAFADATGETIAYEPAGDVAAPVDEPSRYYENLAHVANLRAAIAGGTTVPQSRYQREFPYLFEGRLTREIADRYSAIVTLPPGSAVAEVYVDRVQTSVAAHIDLALWARGRIVFHRTAGTAPTQPQRLHFVLAAPVAADQLSVRIDFSQPGLMRLDDVRALGQTPALRDYVARALAGSPAR